MIHVAAAVLCTVAPVANADGAIVSVETGSETATAQVATETHQRAFVYYDSTLPLQRTILDVRTADLNGSFLWVLPVPERPTDAQAYLAESVREVDADGLDELFALTEPTVQVVFHEVALEYRAPGFACAAASGDRAHETGVTDTVAAEGEDPWAERSTESFDLSLYTGTELSELVSLAESEIGGSEGEAIALRLQHNAAAIDPYLGSSETGPWSILLVRGTRVSNGGSWPALQIDAETDQAVFPLTISRPGLQDRMAVEIITCGVSNLEPEGAVKPYLIEVSVDTWEFTYGSGTDFSGAVYRPSFPVASREQADEPWFVEELTAAIDFAVAIGGSEAWGHQATIKPQAGIPYTDDLSPSDELWISRYRRVFTSAEQMADAVFEPAGGEEFLGRVLAHVSAYPSDRSVSAAATSTDYSILFPISFPAWIAARRVWRRRRDLRRRDRDARRCRD